jgi:hypothetical protein
MIGIKHFVVILCGCVGLVLGGILVDLDHGGTWKDKWNGFWHRGTSEGPMHRGIFHDGFVAWSIIAFSICFGLGYMVHILMDYVKYVN